MSFKEFINESVTVRQETNKGGVYYTGAESKHYDYESIEFAGNLKVGFNKGNWMHVIEYGPSKKPSKQFNDAIVKLENDGWKKESVMWVGPKGQDWTGKIYKEGGMIQAILSK